MTPDRFRECLDITGYSTRYLAVLLNCDDRLIRRWTGGKRPIPDDIAAWLDGLAGYLTDHPPPTRHQPNGDPTSDP